MNISEIITPSLIKMELESEDKRGVIEELVTLLEEEDLVEDREEVVAAVLQREEQGTTGVGHGVAIPHCKSRAVAKPSLAVGISRKGIDFDSMDGKPARLFFLLAVPEESSREHLKLLSGLSRMLVNEEFRKKLLECNNAREVLEVMGEGKTEV